jgi:VanZ family protein
MPGVGRVASIWLPPLAWMVIIFAFSAQHGGGHLPAAEVVLRKLGHAAGYLALTLLLLRALRRSGAAVALSVAVGAALAYAISDEWHQSFVPGRTATARDVAIDGIGIALAALAATRTRLRQLTA